MTRTYLAGTALAALAAPLAAQTVTIDTARTTPVRTATVGTGGTAADVKIATAGSVTVTSGAAVTIDSNNSVTNDGTIKITNADDATGILLTGPRTADITNTGTITIDETYTPTDGDNDGDLDGPFALGSGRAAIRIDGPMTGKIVHTGTITVEGNNSAGIAINAPLTGSLRHDGKTTVTGNNSVGVRANAISGDVRLAGTVAVQGAGSVGAQFAGDIGGRLQIQGDISATGYRKTTAPADVSKLDADDLLQGGSAVLVEGSVAKGIVFDVAPQDKVASDSDEDKDGIEDAKEGNAKVVAFGAAPAVQIGGTAGAQTIGATVGTAGNYGVINNGEIRGEGVYAGVSATGMQIAGRGASVTIANGIQNNGGILANAKAADATGLRFGAGASLPVLHNTNTISATVTGAATDTGTARGIRIDAGASLPTIKNAGLIKATTTAAGTAIAIEDKSGTLALVENAGKISATGATGADAANRLVAIDLSLRAGDAIVRQTKVAATATAPVIEGRVIFGAGNDLFDVADGFVVGKTTFGDGVDELKLSGDAIYKGDVSFGGQADKMSLINGSRFEGTADFGMGAGTLSLADNSVFFGKLANAQNTAVTVNGGTLSLTGANTIGSLTVGATGVLGVTLSKTAGQGTAITVAGTASFTQGSKIAIQLTDILNATGTYTVLSAGTLTGADKLAADAALVPFIYKAALAVTGNTIGVNITRKAVSELGLNAAEGAAFEGLYSALAADAKVAKIFLGIADQAVLQAAVAQTLPDHAGATFSAVSQGLRSFDRHLLDPVGPLEQEGKFRLIGEFAAWGGDKDRGAAAGYQMSGLGFRAGAEYMTGIGAFGVTGSYMFTEHETTILNSINGTAWEGGVHWRGKFGPVQTYARIGAGRASFDGERVFAGGTGADAVDYRIARAWDGDFVNGSAGISIEGGSQFFFFRPSLTIDYLSLKEDGYVETGGGNALNLTVAERESDELAANAGLALGVDMFGMRSRDRGWLRLETEGGWRQVLSGDLGPTVARYGASGTPFVLLPDQRDSGWFARLKGYGGDAFYTIGAELGAEEQYGKTGYAIRASIRFGW